jgi:ribosomal protein L30/L7E
MVEVPIDVLEMLDYFKEDQRTVVEGLRLEKSNSIHNLRVVKVVDNAYIVDGECLSGHDVHKVHTFKLKLADNFENWKLECSCPAGKSGRCKHVMAGVRAVERYVKYISGTLSKIS